MKLPMLWSIILEKVDGQYQLSCNGIILLYGDKAIEYVEKLYDNNHDVKQLVDASEEIVLAAI